MSIHTLSVFCSWAWILRMSITWVLRSIAVWARNRKPIHSTNPPRSSFQPDCRTARLQPNECTVPGASVFGRSSSILYPKSPGWERESPVCRLNSGKPFRTGLNFAAPEKDPAEQTHPGDREICPPGEIPEIRPPDRARKIQSVQIHPGATGPEWRRRARRQGKSRDRGMRIT